MPEVENLSSEESIPFFPDHVKTEFKVVVGTIAVVIIIGVIGMLSPVGIGDPADPLNTPTHVKPEWYFLALYQLLKYIPEATGIAIIIIAMLILIFWPFLNSKKEKTTKPTKIRLVVTIIGVIILIAATVWGEIS